MASFTDIIPQFNPYVEQLPVEAMVQVGMQKQKLYDEGIQKIQKSIDDVAGLSIIKPLHKQYLQSKLNELGNNLKTVAAGDFSNFQLVNSVGGMVNQISKDPVIQNAVYSTQRLQKEQENMQTAQTNGKSSPENEWWFNNGIEQWLNDGNINTKYTGEFIQYTDVDKKLREISDKIKEETHSADNPFQTNADGSYRLDANGNPMIDDAMRRITVKGVSAQKIYENFMSALDENDKRQLLITSNYHYRGATKDTFKTELTSTAGSQKKMLHDNLVDLSVKLKNDNNLTASQRAVVEAAINDGVAKLNDGYFEKKLAGELSQIDNVKDLSDYKYRIYTQKYLTNRSRELANESKTEEILNNPYAQMNMEKKKLEFQVQRAKVEDAHWWANYQLDAARLKIESDKWETEKKEKALLEPVVEYGGLSTDVAIPTLNTVDDGIKATTDNMTALDSKYGALLFPNLTGPALDNAGNVIQRNGKPLTAREQALEKLVADYNINPNNIKDNNQRDYVEQMRGLQNKLTEQNNLYLKTSEVGKPFDEKLNALVAGESGINTTGGQISAKDLLEVSLAYQNAVKPWGSGGTGGGYGGANFDYNAFQGKLTTPKQKEIGRIFQKAWEGKQALSPGERFIFNRAFELQKTYIESANKLSSDKLAAQAKYLSTHMPEVQSTYGTLNMDDKTTAYYVNNLIGNTIDFYNRYGSTDQVNLSDFNPNTITTWRTGDTAKDLKYVAEKKYDGSGKLTIYNGKSKQTIPMTAAQLTAYFPKVAKESFMTNVKFKIQNSPGKTTNAVAVDDPVNAYMSGYQIPGLASSKYAATTRLDIEGSPDNDGGEFDRFQVKMYVYNNNTWKPVILNQQGYVGAAGVEEIISAIGPRTVQDALK
jgi:hypothetical protein